VELEHTDEEQVEALQKWWRENWLSLVSGLVLGLGVILGWQYYGDYAQNQAADASQTYEAIKAKVSAGLLEAAQADVNRLQDAHHGSPYVEQARFALAQAYASKGDWAVAEAQLRLVLDDSSDQALLGLARLRLARTLWAQSKMTEALATLDMSKAGAYAPLYAELRGDIALSEQKLELAKSAYAEALDGDRDYVDRNAIQRKLDALK
jgi:predicted negative regulator of RcsB-dependent stress response